MSTKARRQYRIGQYATCPEIGGFVVIGVLERRSYLTNLLVENGFGARFWIDQDIIRPTKSLPRDQGERLRRLMTEDGRTIIATT